ncbi:MAG: hypothetical protein EA397_19585 [Deltaproteobacteria bacterium]|nr:MAG: hypothetical protein EA397_19585 [Deltaproteobacteria bacterium]
MVHRLLLTILLSSCAVRSASTALPDEAARISYRVGLVAGSGDRTVTDVFTLAAVPKRGGVWSFRVETSESSIEQGAGEISYNSDAPTPADPWPLVAQFAISAVPATIALDDRGRPLTMIDPQRWQRLARVEVERRALPHQAAQSIDALLDPEGLVRDLQRSLPGLPPDQGPWEREEHIAGLPILRRESCERSARGARTTWDCAGTLHIADPELGAKIFEGSSITTVTADRAGMLELDTLYDATLVFVDPHSGQTRDRPIAGRRRVIRQ